MWSPETDRLYEINLRTMIYEKMLKQKMRREKFWIFGVWIPAVILYYGCTDIAWVMFWLAFTWYRDSRDTTI